MNDRSVKDLPDYPALAHLASALWSDGHARGAAVLVGAGFSRNADRAGNDTRHPPLWSDLQAAMAEMLYPGHCEDAPKDALRLAEEFRVYLGPIALVEFLRKHIPDAAWTPGRIHKDLMSLPWADVLTTNYDTLLERTSDRYEVVREAADLAQVRGHRVIKLHGSIDGNSRLVISEEDYRTYPVRSAAFVNTARQVFIENELCLVGFSGDDPNFLQWSGWVRDHLAEGARRIYLVGSLALSPAKRRLLESRNVAPIDFAPLTEHLPRGEAETLACELFLAYLASSKPIRPIDWQPATSDLYDFIPQDRQVTRQLMAGAASAEAMLNKLSAVWKTDVSSCPEWLVMPKDKRQAVELGTARAPWNFVKDIGSAPPAAQISLLSQIAWRCKVALKPLPDDVAAAFTNLAIYENDNTSKNRLELLRTLLADARQARNQSHFTNVADQLEALSTPGSDARADLVAQKLLWARDGLDFASLSTGLSALSGPDPVWNLLRAALHCECGEADLAKPILADACADLASRQQNDRKSIFVASRRAWADVFRRALRMSETFSLEPAAQTKDWAGGYDAEDEIDKLYRELRANRLRRMEEPQGYQPRFGPGAYKDHSRTVHYRSAPSGYEAEIVFRLADAACLPLRAGRIDILVSLARDSLESEPQPTVQWHLRLLRTLTSSSPALERNFDSVSIARLDAGTASELTARVFAAVRFWYPRTRPGARFGSDISVDRLQLFLEVLSRLIVRAEPGVVLEAFHLGRDIATHSVELHHWLYEPLGELLKRSLLSLAPHERTGLALDCLELPLPTEATPTPFRWPNPTAELFSRETPPARIQDSARWSASIARLLAAVGESGHARTHAVHRVAYLEASGCLDERERIEFGRLLWMHRDPDNGQLPLDVDLYPHVIASLPGTLDTNPVEIVRSYLFKKPLDSGDQQRRLSAVAAAASNLRPVKNLLPTHDEAVTLLDEMAVLISRQPAGRHPLAKQVEERLIGSARAALGNTILQCLEATDITEPRLEFIDFCATPGNGGEALAGLHEMARLAPDRKNKTIESLRRAIARGDIHDVEGASLSIVAWAQALASGRYPCLPEILKEALIAALEMGVRQALQPRIWCARRLLKMGAFSTPQVQAISDILPELWKGLAYENMPQEGPEGIGITLARAECVRLAVSLASASFDEKSIIADAEIDPLPEVRFARLQLD